MKQLYKCLKQCNTANSNQKGKLENFSITNQPNFKTIPICVMSSCLCVQPYCHHPTPPPHTFLLGISNDPLTSVLYLYKLVPIVPFFKIEMFYLHTEIGRVSLGFVRFSCGMCGMYLLYHFPKMVY